MQRKTVKKRNSNENLAIATSFSFGNSFADYAGNGKQFPLGYVTVKTKASIPNDRNIQAVTSVDLSQVFATVSAITNRIEKEKTKQEFDDLIKEWVSAVKYKSLESQQINHPAFLRLIAIGNKILPFVFEEFSKRPFMAWLKALPAIVGKDIAAKAKSFPEAVDLWKNWGKENGYLSK